MLQSIIYDIRRHKLRTTVINVAVSFPFSNLVPRVLSVGENSGNEVVRFQEFVRRERVSKTAVFIWLVNLLFTCLEWANCNHIFKGIHLCLWLASLVVIAFSAQCKILLISLRHQRQIKRHNLGTSSQRQMQSKLAINLTSIVAIYFALNLPVLLVTKFHQMIFGYIENYNYYSWAETVALLNSSVNPLFCTWRVKEIREAITDIFVKKRKRRGWKRTTLGEVAENNNVLLVRFGEMTVLKGDYMWRKTSGTRCRIREELFFVQNKIWHCWDKQLFAITNGVISVFRLRILNWI